MKYLLQKKNRGVGLVEIVIASSIISLVLVAIVNVYSLVERRALANIKVLKGTELVEEGVEVVRFLRDSGWTSNIASLQVGTTYRLCCEEGVPWSISNSAPLIEDKYDRTIVISNVYRDSNFNVVSSGGTLDSGSRKVTVSVFWSEGAGTTTKTAETYLFNIFNN